MVRTACSVITFVSHPAQAESTYSPTRRPAEHMLVTSGRSSCFNLAIWGTQTGRVTQGGYPPRGSHRFAHARQRGIRLLIS
jgi:hypothetical protein